MEHNRFVIETMSFCQGNCSGCFFSEQERVGGAFISAENLKKVVSFVSKQVNNLNDCSINFGQGDHLAVKDNEWADLLFHVKQFKGFNALITITTSAIEKFEIVKKRVDELHDLAIAENMKIFFAVVLDPKKLEHKSFSERYVKNIGYIREKFGFIDLTINVGEDTLNYLPPEKLDNFLKTHKFRHLELNLIPTLSTVHKFSSHYKSIVDWFIKFKEISVNQPYLVFHHYHFNHMNKLLENATLPLVRKELENFLLNNLYIGFDLKVSGILSGYTGNALPLTEKTGYIINQSIDNFDETEFQNEQKKFASEMTRNILMDQSCAKCEYSKLCLMSGSMIFKKKEFQALHQSNDCFLGLYRLWQACDTMEGKDVSGVNVQLKPKGQIQENSFGVDELP